MASTDRLEDLIDHPRETLDVEMKSWLDLRDEAGRANLAHAILALANHGGGFVVLGFDEKSGSWARSAGAPPNADAYTQDTVNEIVKKYAEPPFHCDVHRIERGDAAHLVVVVPGGHRVPVRARSNGPENKHVKQHAYYIRRAGPESAPIQSGGEWDALMRRCLQAAKDDLAELIRTAVMGAPLVSAPNTSDRLDAWVSSSEQRLAVLVRENLAQENPSRYHHGVWSFAYALEDPIDLSLPDLQKAMQSAHASITGWPTFLMMTRDEYAPYPLENAIEAWIFDPKSPRDGAHSDFWRASPDGRLYLMRGYQEDGSLKNVAPGTVLDRGLPIWRVAECLLHVQRFAQIVDRGSGRAQVRAQWTGLKGRQLADVAGDWPTGPEGRACRQDVVRADLSISVASIRATLGDLVAQLTAPLYTAFDFSGVPRNRIDAELNRMLRRV